MAAISRKQKVKTNSSKKKILATTFNIFKSATNSNIFERDKIWLFPSYKIQSNFS